MKTLLTGLAILMLVGCAHFRDPDPPRMTPAQSRAMAEEWARYGPPPGYGAYSAPPPMPFGRPFDQRPRVNCMQYGQMGQGGQFSCW